MSATLREDHRQADRLAHVIWRCYTCLDEGRNVPLSDIERIVWVIAEFLDVIHYSREEDSYFACVASYGGLNEEIRRFMIEHEFGRRVARKLSRHLKTWRAGTDSREPVARYLRTYHTYITDHVAKENLFFDEVQNTILSAEEEAELERLYRSVMTDAKTISEMRNDLDYLEKTAWCRGRL